MKPFFRKMTALLLIMSILTSNIGYAFAAGKNAGGNNGNSGVSTTAGGSSSSNSGSPGSSSTTPGGDSSSSGSSGSSSGSSSSSSVGTSGDYITVSGLGSFTSDDSSDNTLLTHYYFASNGQYDSSSGTYTSVDTVSDITISDSTSAVNGIVCYNSNVTLSNIGITLNSSSDGEDTCDFTGKGTALAVYGSSSNVTLEKATILTSGVATMPLFTDNGATLTVRASTIEATGGTLYSDYESTYNQSTMVAPPWVLGIMGTSRASNLMGSNSTLNFLDSTAKAALWAVLSTDSGSNMVMNIYNSTLELTQADETSKTIQASGGQLTTNDNPYTSRYGSGYGTYVIGSCVQNVVGSTFNVGTYAAIFTGGTMNFSTLKSGTYTLTSGDGTTTNSYTYSGSDTVSTINSDTFGFMVHQNANELNMSSGTVLNTGYTGFLIKTGGSLTSFTANITDANITVGNNVLIQLLDNEDDLIGTSGSSFVTTYTESSGWNTSGKSTSASATVTFNFSDMEELQGNIYNASGYQLNGQALTVNLSNTTYYGAAASTTAIHVSKTGSDYVRDTLNGYALDASATDSTLTGYQLTTINISDYYNLGHVANKINSTGKNTVALTLSSGSTWYVTGTSVISSLTVSTDSSIVLVGNATLTVGSTTYSKDNLGSSYNISWSEALPEASTECTHDYVSEVTAPSCTEAGFTTYSCSLCGDSYTANETAALGHTKVTDEAVAATCTATGLTEGSHCSVCGEILTAQTVISENGHSYSSVVTAPTCTTEGYTTYTCSVCEYSYVDNQTQATGHSYNTCEVTTLATCTEAGVRICTCSNCGETITEAIDATGHTVVVDEAVAATCMETGLTEGSHCSVCGTIIVAQTVVAQTSHTAVTVAGYAATCTETGLTEGSKCSVCDETLTEQSVVPATGHDYVSVVTEPTCTEAGYTTYTCSVCGDSYTADKIEATGHTVVTDAAIAATCTETGLTEGSHCSVCNKVLTSQSIIAASGHSYASVITSPTCTEQGYTTYTCVSCGSSYKGDYVDANEHTYVNGSCTSCGAAEEVESSIAINNTTGVKYDTLQEAIDAATSGDTITLLKNVSENITVSADITIDLGGYTITGVDGTVFEIKAAVTIQNGTITGGSGRLRTSGSNTYYDGGAIYVTTNCSLALNNVTVTSNSATYGGGIYAGAYTTLTVTDCVITGNSATSYGGGIYVGAYAALTVTGLVYGNTANTAGADIGISTGTTYSLSTDFGSATDSEGHIITGWYKETATSRYSEDNITDEVSSSGTTSGATYIVAAHGSNPVTHEHSYTAVVTEPTCTENGYTTYTCTCGNVIVSNYTAALGHTEDEAITENEIAAACTESGSYDSVIYCSICGEEISRETVELSATGHSYEAITTAPTCTEQGYTTYTCGICEDSYVSDYTESTNHNYENGSCSDCGAEDPDYEDEKPVLGEFTYSTSKKITMTATWPTSYKGHEITGYGFVFITYSRLVNTLGLTEEDLTVDISGRTKVSLCVSTSYTTTAASTTTKYTFRAWISYIDDDGVEQYVYSDPATYSWKEIYYMYN